MIMNLCGQYKAGLGAGASGAGQAGTITQQAGFLSKTLITEKLLYIFYFNRYVCLSFYWLPSSCH